MYSWYKDGVQLFAPVENREYSFTAVESFSGKYTCSGQRKSDSQTSETSTAVALTVSEKPKPKLTSNHEGDVLTGNSMTLSCTLKLQSAGWKFYWTKPTQSSETETETDSYIISSVSVSDGGQYRCRAGRGNPVYSSDYSDALWINVTESPKAVVTIKPDKRVFKGESVTLRCEIQGGGDTEWTYSWYKNDYELYRENKTQEFSLSSVRNKDSGNYTCRGRRSSDTQTSEISDAVTLTISDVAEAVVSVSPLSWLTEGDSVTLSCEVKHSSTAWTFSWYSYVLYRDSQGSIRYNRELLSDNSRGSGGSYTLSPVTLNHTGVYVCRAERGVFHTPYSKLQPLWITGESPPVSLIISPSRTQHFTADSLSMSCEDQSDSTGWTVRRYKYIEELVTCSSVSGSTCNISSLSTSHTGVYWCQSESGGRSNPINITVHYGTVILDSPVHPVTEGHPLTLHCLSRSKKIPGSGVDFYKDDSILQNQTTGEMTISSVSKSDEGFYHCKHPERGESLKSWVSVRLQMFISLIQVGKAQERPKAVVTLQPDGERFSGEKVTFTCEIRGHADTVDGKWMYNWYKDGVQLFAPVENREYSFTAVESFSGKYTCSGQRKSDSQTSETSTAVTLTVSGKSPPVSLIISPSRTQHFTDDSLSLSCEDQSNSTGWTVRRYRYSEELFNCSSVSGSTCNISSLSTSHTGVYWCQSESGGRSNPVNITVYNGAVILDSPVHPVTEGHPLTLRCLSHSKMIPDSGVDFYKDDSILQSQTTGEMTISSVSKSDEGFYHCKHPERGESLKSWVSVRVASSSVLRLISSLVTVSVYLLLTIVVAVKCFRARVQMDEDNTQNAVIEEQTKKKSDFVIVK
ncbi:Fc receptor-like protein 5 [Hemibagrus wyckioides]|uniref:Fc receptor-like protein 5 n=1 Tax=Hemibagrus wyckioides TaxID=337641 RepID=UPI00266D13FF|nr:Fc receptor-like protein 5 [Hemibagrus wyckioides]